MYLAEAIEMLRGGDDGIKLWNAFRDVDGAIPDLSGAELSRADLRATNLRRTKLDGADLSGADLSGADLSGADLDSARLDRADLSGANCRSANLSRARLDKANLSGADFSRANLWKAFLSHTIFANVDLSGAKGLDSVAHVGPSILGVDTIYRSKGKIPEAFYRGCGVPEHMIRSLPSILNLIEPIQFYSCFISYSSDDEDFAKRLHSRMVQEKLRVWFAPEDAQAGEYMQEQIDRAIQVQDRLLLVLSKHSMESNWVMHEIRRARKTELKENRRKLFPIRLVDFEELRDWECHDAGVGEDLAVEIRRYFIPDFSNWKDHDSFEAGFSRLLTALKSEASTGVKPT
jgi:TIR domain/Pentapeptide repeats (8 copies)